MTEAPATLKDATFTVSKLTGTALLWVGLAALAYVPSAAGGVLTLGIAAGGFLSFVAGLLLFFDGLKGEIILQLKRERHAG